MNETINNILSRQTIRSYKKEQISDEALDTIIKAAVKALPAGAERERGRPRKEQQGEHEPNGFMTSSHGLPRASPF